MEARLAIELADQLLDHPAAKAFAGRLAYDGAAAFLPIIRAEEFNRRLYAGQQVVAAVVGLAREGDNGVLTVLPVGDVARDFRGADNLYFYSIVWPTPPRSGFQSIRALRLRTVHWPVDAWKCDKLSGWMSIRQNEFGSALRATIAAARITAG